MNTYTIRNGPVLIFSQLYWCILPPALLLIFSLLQHVLGCVKMEEHALSQPVHVTVQMVTVGTPVEVSVYFLAWKLLWIAAKHWGILAIVSPAGIRTHLSLVLLGRQLWHWSLVMIDGPLVNSGKDTIVTIELNVLASCRTACIRLCQNGGTLDKGTCMCDCSGGFSGNNCESECSFCHVYICPGCYVRYTYYYNPQFLIYSAHWNCILCLQTFINHHIVYVQPQSLLTNILCSCGLHYFFPNCNLACSLSCQNGGTLNMTSCTCDCADGFSGSSCESELQAYFAHCSLTYFPTQRPDNIITFIVPLGRLYKGS